MQVFQGILGLSVHDDEDTTILRNVDDNSLTQRDIPEGRNLGQHRCWKTSNLATEKEFDRVFKILSALSRRWTVWPTGAIFTLKVTKEEEQLPDVVFVDKVFLGNFTRHLQLHFTVDRSSVVLETTRIALISSVNKSKFDPVYSTKTHEGV
jgi:hypothetical protein